MNAAEPRRPRTIERLGIPNADAAPAAPRIVIVFHSGTGNVAQLAEAAAARAAERGATVSVHRLPELSEPEAFAAVAEAAITDLAEADAVLWGTPGRFGAMSGEMKHFIDQLLPLHQRGVLAGTFMSTFTSTASNHGGQEAVILGFNTLFYHWGAIIVPAGAAGVMADPANANPYGVSSVSAAAPEAVRPENLAAMGELVDRLVGLCRACRASPGS